MVLDSVGVEGISPYEDQLAKRNLTPQAGENE
jgi:hypothetical protein